MENRYFGKNLVKLRKERQLSQNDLAVNLNVTISAISKWENNKNMPDIDMLKTLSKFFEIPLDELLRNPEEDFEPEEQIEVDIFETEPIVLDEEAPSTKKISRPILITAIVTLALIVIAVAVGIYTKANMQPTMPFRIMNSRTVEDEVWGTTTEIGVYITEELDNDIFNMVSHYIKSQWRAGKIKNSDSITTIRINFYDDKSSAKDISPDADSYLFIFDKE